MHWTILNSGDQEVLPAKAQGRPRKTKTFIMYGLPYIRFLTCPATLVVADRAPLDPGKSLLSSPCPRPQSGRIREGFGGLFQAIAGGGGGGARGTPAAAPDVAPASSPDPGTWLPTFPCRPRAWQSVRECRVGGEIVHA